MRTRILIPIALSLCLMACKDKDGDSGGGNTDDCISEGFDGAGLYSDNCAACHAADGSGASGPSLETAVPNRSDDDILSAIRDGGGGMPSFDSLTCGEQTAILEYLRSEHGDGSGT